MNGKPAGLSYRQFERLIRIGEESDEPGEILQIMPWPIYAKMMRVDIRAMYEYLSAIPSLDDNLSPGV